MTRTIPYTPDPDPSPIDFGPDRVAHLRITGRMDDARFRHTLRDLAEVHTNAAQHLDVSMYVQNDPPATEPTHPERDALFALADEWRAGEDDDSTYRHCADQLLRLVATLDL